ncbi:hypothetical protein D3C86_1953760 [compost metagenome]
MMVRRRISIREGYPSFPPICLVQSGLIRRHVTAWPFTSGSGALWVKVCLPSEGSSSHTQMPGQGVGAPDIMRTKCRSFASTLRDSSITPRTSSGVSKRRSQRLLVRGLKRTSPAMEP